MCIPHATMDPVQAVTVELAIDPDGVVASSVGKGRDPAMNTCIAHTISTVRFAKQHGAGWHHGKVIATLIVLFSS